MDNAPAQGVTLLDYTGANSTRNLGAWFHDQRNYSLALPSPAPSSQAAVNDLINRIHSQAGIDNYNAVLKGTNIPGQNYDASNSEWIGYCKQVTDGLKDVSGRNERKLHDTIVTMRTGEEQAFGGWLRETVFGDTGWLSGEAGTGRRPDGIEDVVPRLDELDQNARDLESRVAADGFLGGDTVDDLDKRINALTDKFEKPDEIKVQPSGLQRALALGAAAIVGLGGLALQPVWESISSFGAFGDTSVSELLVWLGVIFTAVLAHRIVTWASLRKRREEASLQRRRQAAEESLFTAYRLRERVRARQGLLRELRGSGPKQAFFRELREQIESVRSEVNDLDALYRGLHDQAAAVVSQADSNPAHVLGTVGDCLDDEQSVDSPLVAEITQRLRVDATLGSNHRIRSVNLRLQPLAMDDGGRVQGVSVSVRDVLAAITSDNDTDGISVRERESENRWRDAVWNLVNWKLGTTLPDTFEDALLHCAGGDATAAAADLAVTLSGVSFPRRPSVDLQVPATVPVFRQMYAGSLGILAALNTSLQNTNLDRLKAREIAQYARTAKVVSSLGEQIVFLDLWADDGGRPWAPWVISNAVEAKSAHDTYYGLTDAPDSATAKGNCFTVLPELLAATKLELGGLTKPLEPAVTARLLGSDLDQDGPTYAELFYLLRARNQLVFEREGNRENAKIVVNLKVGAGDSLPLAEFPVSGVTDSRFGRGRERIVAFDAFCEFMRFDGRPIEADAAAQTLFQNATLRKVRLGHFPKPCCTPSGCIGRTVVLRRCRDGLQGHAQDAGGRPQPHAGRRRS